MLSRQYTFNNSILTIKFGNIVDSKSDVIVSSDDSLISMGGGVSLAILKAGGPDVIRDAQKMCPAPLGDVVVATAGNLEHQKYIYHCITIDQKRHLQILGKMVTVTEEDILDYLLQHSVDKCFQLLQAMELGSIAFPALGAGVARIPIRKVIEQMSIAIARNLANTNKSLSVELYLYDIYHLYSESDYITLFESMAAKAALVEYEKKLTSQEENVAYPSADVRPLTLRGDMTHKVFISYSRKDQVVADILCKILKDNGIDYWIDKNGIYSSFNYKEMIVDAIDVSKAVVFVSSENSNSSVNVIREIGYAVNMNKPIVPLILDEAPYARSIRLDISDIDKIDFRKPYDSTRKLIASLMYIFNR